MKGRNSERCVCSVLRDVTIERRLNTERYLGSVPSKKERCPCSLNYMIRIREKRVGQNLVGEKS